MPLGRPSSRAPSSPEPYVPWMIYCLFDRSEHEDEPSSAHLQGRLDRTNGSGALAKNQRLLEASGAIEDFRKIGQAKPFSKKVVMLQFYDIWKRS
jgi:hypothetical protein